MPKIIFKAGVPDVKTDMKPARLEIAKVHDDFWQESLTVTSTNDGKHGRDSLHYRRPPRAEDYRLPLRLRAYLDALRKRLGPDYQVILEKDHIHVELDIKGG